MKPSELERTLHTVIERRLHLTVMLWGKPGIGKSAIVHDVGRAHDLPVFDTRISQLAPTDLRGLPIPDLERGVARWLPPQFLPREERGILFLDELNMAPPVMQGIAQQLILDRRLGDYEVPQGVFIWAAGNRKEDRAAVFDMTRPVANRMIHLHLEEDLGDFRAYAARRGVHEHVVAFLGYRPALLHDMNGSDLAFPSPRTWEMAGQLHAAGLGVAPAVGNAAAGEFEGFLRVYDRLPDAEAILARGPRAGVSFPRGSDERWAITTALALRARTPHEAGNALKWIGAAHAEWMQLTASLLLPRLRAEGHFAAFAALLTTDSELEALMDRYADVLS
ncbi:ATP-binding protein [Deinococcus yavapaiensis]|uniref:Dynein-related subfamily AAA family protein n=1 Tax=Deinococcus yavapaiensis KR-236 TaxID=694435 RepID=A0A318S4W9_9DEIO|nr:MoxR family ATPase [Deinococcus yavapaiensis]PYE53127.1 dynein-related subfamily AAA family protein [Deinococcus yavapaiensis KR-236]